MLVLVMQIRLFIRVIHLKTGRIYRIDLSHLLLYHFTLIINESLLWHIKVCEQVLHFVQINVSLPI